MKIKHYKIPIWYLMVYGIIEVIKNPHDSKCAIEIMVVSGFYFIFSYIWEYFFESK